MTWQALISEAAAQCFLQNGKVPVFRLARPDLVQLAAEVMNRPSASIAEELEGLEGFLGFRCLVHCEQLGRAVAVDEWAR